MRLLFLMLLAAPLAFAQEAPDEFLWLEEVESAEALAWAEEQTATTLAELEAHPAYQGIYEDALEVFSSNERIAYPSLMGAHVYNFWQDADNPRGLWRRMDREAYLAGETDWETVLDVDALGAEEGVNWTVRGTNCLAPDYRRCLIALSRAGADATEVREFDLESKAFVDGGFVVLEAKTNIAWRDADAIYLGTDTGENSMTTSGYARTIRVWERGTPMADAPLLFEGEATDVSVSAFVVRRPEGDIHLATRGVDFYTREYHLIDGDTVRRLDIPTDATPSFVSGQLVLRLRSDWAPEGEASETFPQGALVSIAWEDFLAGSRAFETVFAPTERSSVRQVATTESTLLVGTLDNVQGRLTQYRYQGMPSGGRWVATPVETPEAGVVSVTSTSDTDDTFFFSYESFLQPTTLYVHRGGAPEEVRSLPAFFDKDGLVTEQHEAVSADGTRIPYFVVRHADAPMDGSNPTLLYGYGGFEVSMTPGYSAVRGATWLARGGVYVLANIRGGGEFGPGWHRSALRENRQRAYDDFIAVAEDLIERGITSPERLGVEGGSNGGLLTGVMLTQRPDLFNASIIAVPLLDMQRYHLLLAGASWMAEYGNPDVPEDWAFIREYSPYQNLREDANYPRPLIYTSTRDDRVHPGHARKMAARMHAMGHEALYFEIFEGGHAAAVTPEQRAGRAALTTTYLVRQLMD